MISLINILYLLLIIIFLAMGAAIAFHLLYYRINRRAAGIMFLIYAIGALILLASTFILFRQVNWYQIFSNYNF